MCPPPPHPAPLSKILAMPLIISMCCFRVGTVSAIGEKNISSHAHKTGSCCLLGVLFKMSYAHPRPSFYVGVPHPGTRSSWHCALKLFLLDQLVTETSLEVKSNGVTNGTTIPSAQFWLGLAVSGLLKPLLYILRKSYKYSA